MENFEDTLLQTDKDYLLIPDKKLFDLMICGKCPGLDLHHILILSKIYAWMIAPSYKNEYGACRQPNSYFVNYFHKSSEQIKRYLNKLESYGLIIRYQNKQDFCTTKERYIWINAKLINRLIKKDVFDEDNLIIPEWVVDNAKSKGWRECDDDGVIYDPFRKNKDSYNRVVDDPFRKNKDSYDELICEPMGKDLDVNNGVSFNPNYNEHNYNRVKYDLIAKNKDSYDGVKYDPIDETAKNPNRVINDPPPGHIRPYPRSCMTLPGVKYDPLINKQNKLNKQNKPTQPSYEPDDCVVEFSKSKNVNSPANNSLVLNTKQKFYLYLVNVCDKDLAIQNYISVVCDDKKKNSDIESFLNSVNFKWEMYVDENNYPAFINEWEFFTRRVRDEINLRKEDEQMIQNEIEYDVDQILESEKHYREQGY